MICYDLYCDQGYDFDGWFWNFEGFEILKKVGQVICVICGSVLVEKVLMVLGVVMCDL